MGDYGLIPGGSRPVAVVRVVMSLVSACGDHVDYVVKAGVHTEVKSVKSLNAIEACGCGPTSGRDPDDVVGDVYDTAVCVSVVGVATNVMGVYMSCPSLLSAREELDADSSTETSLGAPGQCGVTI